MKNAEQILTEHPFGQGLSPAQIALLVRGAVEVRFGQDEFIFREREDAERFYLIVEGSVAIKMHVPQAGAIPIETISAGQALGWSWLIPPHKWHFDAQVFSPVTALALDAPYLRQLFEQDPELGYRVLQRINRVLAERLQATQLQLMDVYQTAT